MSAAGADTRPLVFVSVGTDHHRFDRLVTWLDSWLESGRRDQVRCVMQVGTSAKPRHAESVDYLDYTQMSELIRSAHAVVCHGGPGTIALATSVGGIRPIVVPRTRALGEHVDDHQVVFTRRIAAEGAIDLADTEGDLHEALDAALANGRSDVASDRAEVVGSSVRRLAAFVDDLLDRRRADGPPVPVIYIAGMGRSGSTLLDLLLGEVKGLVPVGELRFIWERGLKDNQLCGCGRPFLDCPFWTRVGQIAFGGWDRVDVDRMVELEATIDRHRYLPLLLAPWLAPAFRLRLGEYAEALDHLYRAIVEASDGGVVVDSTKDPPYAYLLRHVGGVDLRLVHLVRDPRGVAHSWTKLIKKPERVDVPELLDRYDPLSMSLRWTVYNILFHVMRRLRLPYRLVRYEDVVARPEDHLREIAALGGTRIGPRELDWLHADDAELGVHHTVAGNPMRFQRGRIVLRVDDAWKSKLTRRQQRAITALTLPLLRRYGYPLGAADLSKERA